MARRYNKEFKERAVMLLADSRGNHTSETQALQGVAKDLGIATESLRRWLQQADTAGPADSGESEELKRLRKENDMDWFLFPVSPDGR